MRELGWLDVVGTEYLSEINYYGLFFDSAAFVSQPMNEESRTQAWEVAHTFYEVLFPMLHLNELSQIEEQPPFPPADWDEVPGILHYRIIWLLQMTSFHLLD